MKVATYLRQVLQENDEVVLQDVGVFQASYASAEINPNTHLFLPPNKSIHFTTKLKASNLVLENFISQKESISLEEAQELVKAFVRQLKANLDIDRSFLLEDLGELVLQVGGEIEFKQNKQTIILDESFGLPEIYAKLIDREAPPLITPEVSSSSKRMQPPPIKEESRNAWGTVAAIASLTLLVVAVIYVVAIDSSLNPFNKLLSKKRIENSATKQVSIENQTANISAENSDTASQQKEVVLPNTQPSTQTETTNLNLQAESNTENQNLNTNTNSTNQIETAQQRQSLQETKPTQNKGDDILVGERSNQFFIVIAGFANQANAYKKAREAKKLGLENIKIIPPFDAKRLYRVAVGGYSSRSEADTKLEEIRNVLGVDAWILRY